MDQPQAAGVDWDERVVKAGRRAVLAHLLELPLGGLQLEDTGEPYFGEQNARQRAMREETVERVMGVIVPALGLGGAAAEAQAARRRLRWLYSGAAKSLSPLCYTDKALQLTARFHSQLSVLVPPPEEERVGQAAGGADPLCSWNGDAVELIMEHLIPFDYSLRQHVKIVQGLCELAFTCEAVEMARVADVLYEAVKDTEHEEELKPVLQAPIAIAADMLNLLHDSTLAREGADALLSVEHLLYRPMADLFKVLRNSHDGAAELLPLLYDTERFPLQDVSLVCGLLHGLVPASLNMACGSSWARQYLFKDLHIMPFGQDQRVCHTVHSYVGQLEPVVRPLLALCSLLEPRGGPATAIMQAQLQRRIAVAGFFDERWGQELLPEGAEGIVAAFVQDLKQEFGTALEAMQKRFAEVMQKRFAAAEEKGGSPVQHEGPVQRVASAQRVGLEQRLTAVEQEVERLRAQQATQATQQQITQRAFWALMTMVKQLPVTKEEEEAIKMMGTEEAPLPFGSPMREAAGSSHSRDTSAAQAGGGRSGSSAAAGAAAGAATGRSGQGTAVAAAQGGSGAAAGAGQRAKYRMTHEEWARRKRVEEEAKRQAASRLQELLDNRGSRRIKWELGGRHGEIDRFAFGSTLPREVLRQRLASLRR